MRRDGRSFDRADYYAHPDAYVSEFHTKVRSRPRADNYQTLNAHCIQIAPYLSLLLHGAGWGPAFPRLMTNEQLTTTLETAQTLGKGRFACVGDISCDVEVSLHVSVHLSLACLPLRHSGRPRVPHTPHHAVVAVLHSAAGDAPGASALAHDDGRGHPAHGTPP